MRRSFGSSPGGERSIWYILGWGAIVMIGIALVWFGFFASGGRDGSEDADASPTVTTAVDGYPTAVPTMAPPTRLPTQAQPTSPLPTPTLPATVTPVPSAKLVAGDSGVNVRSGPGTSFTLLGYLDPGTSAGITGKYEDWFQIDYEGGPGWVFGDLVAATNTDSVPVVQPPTAPTSRPPQATTVPTAVPPTEVPAPPADTRGIVVNSYSVRSAPGPFGVGAEIWFDLNITNKSGNTIQFNALGTWVEQTGQFQKSWSYSSRAPNQNLVWSDKIHIPAAGNYNLWLAIEFSDSMGAKLSGPIPGIVQ